MIYILFALLLICLSVMTHVIFCRGIKKQVLQVKAYVIIAIISLGVYAAGANAIGQGGFLDPHSLWGLPLKITAGVIFALMAPVYLIFYTSTLLMSPSKKILLTISRLGNPSYADIVHCMQEEDFIGTRIKDLCISGCVNHAQGSYTLSPSGQKIAAVLNIMQRILGRGMGG